MSLLCACMPTRHFHVTRHLRLHGLHATTHCIVFAHYVVLVSFAISQPDKEP